MDTAGVKFKKIGNLYAYMHFKCILFPEHFYTFIQSLLEILSSDNWKSFRHTCISSVSYSSNIHITLSFVNIFIQILLEIYSSSASSHKLGFV